MEQRRAASVAAATAERRRQQRLDAGAGGEHAGEAIPAAPAAAGGAGDPTADPLASADLAYARGASGVPVPPQGAAAAALLPQARLEVDVRGVEFHSRSPLDLYALTAFLDFAAFIYCSLFYQVR